MEELNRKKAFCVLFFLLAASSLFSLESIGEAGKVAKCTVTTMGMGLEGTRIK